MVAEVQFAKRPTVSAASLFPMVETADDVQSVDNRQTKLRSAAPTSDESQVHGLPGLSPLATAQCNQFFNCFGTRIRPRPAGLTCGILMLWLGARLRRRRPADEPDADEASR
jgi:hypothetical protein